MHCLALKRTAPCADARILPSKKTASPWVVLGLSILCGPLAAPAVAQAPVPAPAAAQAPPRFAAPTTPLIVENLGGGAYLVVGGISHTVFVVGNTSVIALDPQMFVETAKRQLAEIAKITDKPVKTVVVTHTHPDHINGLPAYAPGVRIIAHENAKTEMEAIIAGRGAGTPPPPELKDYLPTETIRHQADLNIDGVRVVLTHLAASHTDADLVVYLPAQKLVYLADLVTTGDPNMPGNMFPVLGRGAQNSAGWLQVMKAALALDANTYIVSHGPPKRTKSELAELVARTEARRTEIKRLFDQGKNAAEIKAAVGEAPPAEGRMRAPSFVDTVYGELLHA